MAQLSKLSLRGYLMFVAATVVVVVVATLVALSWQIAGRTDAYVERLATQAQLLIAVTSLVFSMVLAATTVYFASATRSLERMTAESLADQRQDRLRAQADMVSAWTAHVEVAQGNEEPTCVATIQLRNASAAPIYRCSAVARPHWGDFEPANATEVGGAYWAVLPPGDLTIELDVDPLPELLTAPPVELMFTDAAGRHWRRRVDGVLEPLELNSGGVC